MSNQDYLNALDILKSYNITIIDRKINLGGGKFSVTTAYYGNEIYDIQIDRYGPILSGHILYDRKWSHKIYDSNKLLEWILRCESDKLSVFYYSSNCYELLTSLKTYRIDCVFNKEVYSWITQVLKLECPIGIFYDWVIDKYPELIV